MIRKQVYIEERQERVLKNTARKLGVPEAELIRRGIDQSLNTTSLLAPRAGLSTWAKEKQYIARSKPKTTPRKVTRWARAELYE